MIPFAKALFFCCFLMKICMGQAQGLPAGDWVGELNLGGANTHQVIFSFRTSGVGETKVLVSIPSTGMHDLQASNVVMRGDSLLLNIKDHMSHYMYKAFYDDKSGTIEGVFAVFGSKGGFPLNFKPTDAASLRPARPQTPQGPFSYDVLPITFAGGDKGITLKGTITAPKGRRSVPGIVLISGSGPHNRDGEQFYHKTFMVLADALTKKGFAVLRYDERGVGESSGNYAGNFTEDFARDAAAAVAALRDYKKLRIKDVFVVGHSEGTLMAQIVAAQDPAIAGVVLLAAAGQTGVEFNKTQYRATLRAQGKPEAGQELEIFDKCYEIVAASPDSAAAVANLHNWFDELEIEPRYRAMFINPVMNPWRYHSLHFDPSPFQHKIKAPVLAITGDNDSQTPAEPNLAAIKAGLREGGNTNFTGVVLPKVNHFMQTSIKGTYDEPYTLEETLSPEVLKMMSDWLLNQAQKSGYLKASTQH
ncbi:alpha/beta hydrolase family protein [Pontibacter litorisediminis]|uniref:alpha/beta hydrolase family protein n=1 Tax=Pontibacter litorisediminis TaxID=1846260 RepID=UPI0023ED2007|nr:alpha/beta fold hydrolase [Pontibacter litorisediminis]